MHTKPRTQRSPHRDGRRGDGSHFTVPKSPSDTTAWAIAHAT
jgi:hypothetical protein